MIIITNYIENIRAGFIPEDGTKGDNKMKRNITYPLIFLLLILFISCGPSPEELSDEWWNYSRDKLENSLTQIMSQKDSNGEYVYQNYPVYSWSEQTGYVNCRGELIYKQNGLGSASLSCPVGGSANASGSWKIQWAPVTNSSPYDSDIIFSINESMKFSHHIGSDNKLWTSVESFFEEHFSATDAKKMMAFGDSLRNAFMNEKGLIIGSDGRFKKK